MFNTSVLRALALVIVVQVWGGDRMIVMTRRARPCS